MDSDLESQYEDRFLFDDDDDDYDEERYDEDYQDDYRRWSRVFPNY